MLMIAGDDDVRAVARTSVLSRRWRSLPASLPWPHVVTDFSLRPVDRQRIATLQRLLAVPASKRVVQTLILTLVLKTTAGHDDDSDDDDDETINHARRVVGDAVDTGRVRNVDLEVFGQIDDSFDFEEAPTMLGHGESFLQFILPPPPEGAFRSALTKLSLRNVFFRDTAVVTDLILRGCEALESLSLNHCGFLPEDVDDAHPPVLTVDLPPRSRLSALECDLCFVRRVDLVRAPALVRFRCHWSLEYASPVSFAGHTPSLKGLFLYHGSRGQVDDDEVGLKLSDILVNLIEGQLEGLYLGFVNGKSWVQPESPRLLSGALGRLRVLHVTNVSSKCKFAWAFLLEAAPFLEELEIHIYDHLCETLWREKKIYSDVRQHGGPLLGWKPSPGFKHHHLNRVLLRRLFNVEKNLPFARLLVGLAVNLQTLTLEVMPLNC